MDPQTLVTLLLIGAAAGILSGFIGIGGGLLIVPALMYFMGMSQMAAQGTSLALMLPPIGALAVMNYWKAGEVDVRAAAVMVLAFVAGGYFGSRIALSLDPLKVRLAFGLVMLLVAVRMIVQTTRALWIS
ncbi:MAG: sulfite exporter TauE/SafE family protein [Crocinitomicaceae bacterium TMED114]|nr:MAG: sulfite exporter TauE/SafE family protein [Crocinitomicaceae bacterium TMED114]